MEITIQEILNLYLEKFASRNPVPKEILHSARNIMKCRTTKMGGHEFDCPKCGCKKITYNSCKNKNCPVCSKVHQLNWLSEELKRLPDLPYNHLIFTVPHEFNKYYTSDKKLFCNLVFESVQESLIELIDKKNNITSGHKLQMHTNDQLMGIHIHIHVMTLKGGIDQNGNWKELDYLVWIPRLIDTYREKLVSKVMKNINEFELEKSKSELHNELERLSKKKWKVHLAKDFKNHAEKLLEYFSKRIKGCFVKEERILGKKNGRILLEFRDVKRQEKRIGKLEPLEFIRRFLYHIPMKGQKLNRNYGLFHHSRKTELERLVELFGCINSEKEVIDVEVKCEHCGSKMENVREIDPMIMIKYDQLKLNFGIKKVVNFN